MSDCIHTTYETSAGGYGRLKVAGKKVLHHRLVYCLSNKIELSAIEGLQVMHTCDTPSCINPAHLVLGTHADNMADKAAKGRVKGELAGRAKLTEAQVLMIRQLAPLIQYSLLGTQFQVSVSTIKDIVARKIWTHI
jgi:hypothetical protein